MKFEEWLKMGYQFLDSESKKAFDSFSNGQIRLESCLDIMCEEYQKRRNTPNLEHTHPCYGCCHHSCLLSLFYDDNKTEEENIAEFCNDCPCNMDIGCNNADEIGCDNYQICDGIYC